MPGFYPEPLSMMWVVCYQLAKINHQISILCMLAAKIAQEYAFKIAILKVKGSRVCSIIVSFFKANWQQLALKN